MPCRICGNAHGNRSHQIREQALDADAAESPVFFTYVECAACGCLQISDMPEDMSRYYRFSVSPTRLFQSPLKNAIRSLRDAYAVLGEGIVGKLLYARFPHPQLRSLAAMRLTRASRILDVGCGAGIMLYLLRNAGFANVLGIDPYVEADVTYPNGLVIFKRFVQDLDGQWDCVMLHHSFEHMPNPQEALRSCARLLVEGGTCLIRVPTVSSDAWRIYGADWVQVDAPRHFFLHSRESIRLVAESCGFEVREMADDSTAFQFWGSELHRQGIYVASEGPQTLHAAGFSAREMSLFKDLASYLNARGRGDQIAVYLLKRV